jgi:Esterase PHB depolymerase
MVPARSSALCAMQGGGPAAPRRGVPTGEPPRTVPAILFHGDRDKTVNPRNADHLLAHHRRADREADDEPGAGTRRVRLHPRHLPRRRRSRRRGAVDRTRARACLVGRKPPRILHRPQGTRRLRRDGEVLPRALAAGAGVATERAGKSLIAPTATQRRCGSSRRRLLRVP